MYHARCPRTGGGAKRRRVAYMRLRTRLCCCQIRSRSTRACCFPASGYTRWQQRSPTGSSRAGSRWSRASCSRSSWQKRRSESRCASAGDGTGDGIAVTAATRGWARSRGSFSGSSRARPRRGHRSDACFAQGAVAPPAANPLFGLGGSSSATVWSAAMGDDSSFASGRSSGRRVAATAGAPGGCSSQPAAARRLVFVQTVSQRQRGRRCCSACGSPTRTRTARSTLLLLPMLMLGRWLERTISLRTVFRVCLATRRSPQLKPSIFRCASGSWPRSRLWSRRRGPGGAR